MQHGACYVVLSAEFWQDFHPYLTDLHLINHTFCRICFFLIFFETRWLFLLLFLSHRTLRILLFFFIWHTVYIACVVLGNPCFNENHKVPCNTMHSVYFYVCPTGKTHYKSIRYCYLFSQIISFFVSRRSHKSHRWRFASPALVGLAECFQPDGKRECNDAFFVRLPFPYGRRTRFVRSA